MRSSMSGSSLTSVGYINDTNAVYEYLQGFRQIDRMLIGYEAIAETVQLKDREC